MGLVRILPASLSESRSDGLRGHLPGLLVLGDAEASPTAFATDHPQARWAAVPYIQDFASLCITPSMVTTLRCRRPLFDTRRSATLSVAWLRVSMVWDSADRAIFAVPCAKQLFRCIHVLVSAV